MFPSWLVLLPPLLILIATVITKRLNISLILGLVAAAAIAGNFSFIKSGELLLQRLFAQATDPENLYLYAFLIILGIIISLFEYTGAAMAFAYRLTKKLTTAKNTQTSALLLSTSLCIDDYLSCLTTGYVMRPLTDKFQIPRAKLAYLIHSLSGPLVILAPISSWIALITSQLENAGISPLVNSKTRIIADPFFIYLKSIPFIFYSIILIASVWLIVRRSISFGPMHKQEVIAQKTGNLFGGKKPIHAESFELQSSSSSMWDLIIPLVVLISCFIIGIEWVGGYSLLGGNYSFLEALQKNNRTGFVLFIASIITLGISLCMSFMRKTFSFSALKLITYNGFSMMRSSIVMVFLASTLGIMLREDLQTGAYLAQALYGTISIALLPLLFYIISIITALITGSAWGTIALMVPIAVQMITSLLAIPLPANPMDVTILFPVLGAIFSGAACGNHVSPIAETTIMSSNSAGCYILDHANTQFWYTLPVIISAAVSFLCCGLLMHYPLLVNATISLTIGAALCICGLFAADRWFK